MKKLLSILCIVLIVSCNSVNKAQKSLAKLQNTPQPNYKCIYYGR